MIEKGIEIAAWGFQALMKVLKVVWDLLMGIPKAYLLLFGIIAGIFVVYQAYEHKWTSGITSFLVTLIAFIFVLFVLIQLTGFDVSGLIPGI